MCSTSEMVSIQSVDDDIPVKACPNPDESNLLDIPFNKKSDDNKERVENDTNSTGHDTSCDVNYDTKHDTPNDTKDDTNAPKVATLGVPEKEATDIKNTKNNTKTENTPDMIRSPSSGKQSLVDELMTRLADNRVKFDESIKRHILSTDNEYVSFIPSYTYNYPIYTTYNTTYNTSITRNPYSYYSADKKNSYINIELAYRNLELIVLNFSEEIEDYYNKKIKKTVTNARKEATKDVQRETVENEHKELFDKLKADYNERREGEFHALYNVVIGLMETAKARNETENPVPTFHLTRITDANLSMLRYVFSDKIVKTERDSDDFNTVTFTTY